MNAPQPKRKWNENVDKMKLKMGNNVAKIHDNPEIIAKGKCQLCVEAICAVIAFLLTLIISLICFIPIICVVWKVANCIHNFLSAVFGGSVGSTASGAPSDTVTFDEVNEAVIRTLQQPTSPLATTGEAPPAHGALIATTWSTRSDTILEGDDAYLWRRNFWWLLFTKPVKIPRRSGRRCRCTPHPRTVYRVEIMYMAISRVELAYIRILLHKR